MNKVAFIGALLLGWAGTVGASVNSLQATLVFKPCEVRQQGTAVSRKLECAIHHVKLAPELEQTLEISVIKIKAKSKRPKADPILMLAGGPGQAASEAYLFADHSYSKLSRNRDIYLIDQRGTGRSTLFHCDGMGIDIINDEYDETVLKSLTVNCLQNFPYDARYFSTSVAILDFESVRQALGIEHWNLIGVSYGTRVAQHYLRKFPNAVRSVVLDSVVYPEHNLGLEIAAQSQRALDSVVSRCEREELCRNTFPSLKPGLEQLIQRLGKESVFVEYEDLRTGKKEAIHFSLHHLIIAVRLSLYSDEMASLLPLLFHEAYANDNFSPLARKAMAIANKMDGVIALGMHNSVMCTEDVAFFPKTLDTSLKEETTRSYIGGSLIEMSKSMCSVWPKGIMDSDYKEALHSDKPVLLFSGEYDPITPPEYAEKAKAHLSNAKHFVLKGQGHSVSTTGCAPVLVAKFIEELSPLSLNGSCLDNLSPAPFFIDFNGPTP